MWRKSTIYGKVKINKYIKKGLINLIFQLPPSSSESRRGEFHGIKSSSLRLRTDETRTTDRRNHHQFRDNRFGIGNEFVAAIGAEK